MNISKLIDNNQLKWFARLERDVIEHLSSLKQPLTPQRDCRQKVHMTLADAAELGADGQALCLFEIKGRKLFEGDSVVGNLLNMFHEDNYDFDGQWQRLINMGVPYMFVIAYHKVQWGQGIEEAYKGLDDCPIHDWVVIIGNGVKCAMHRYNQLTDLNLPGSTYAEGIIETLSSCRQFKYSDLFDVSNLPAEKLRGQGAEDELSKIYYMPAAPQSSRSITDIEGISQHIAQRLQSGMNHKQVLDELISKNITHDNRPLIIADIHNRLPPTSTMGQTYEEYEQAFINCFIKAYSSNHKYKNRIPTIKSTQRFVDLDGVQIREAAERGELPSELVLGRSTLNRWYKYHPQRPFLVSCKSQARYRFINKLNPTPVKREDYEKAVQGELWAYGSAKLCNENRQRITELQTEVALLKKALTLMAEALS